MAVVHRTRAEEIALGMTLLGLLFSSILYGLALSQLYTYYKRFPRDALSVKLLVVATALLDTTSVVLETHACWFYLVTTGPIQRAVWSLNTELAVSMFISGIAEAFMTYRVWMLSGRRNLLTCLLLVFAFLHLISGEVSAAEFLELNLFAKFASVASILRLSSACICDTGIAISLCYFLQKKRTGYKRTDGEVSNRLRGTKRSQRRKEIIDYLILFSVNSGLITSLASIACLVTYITIPKTWVYITLCFLISRLYSNTFLFALNSRHVLQTDDNDMDTPALPRFARARRLSRMTSEKRTTRPTQIDVFVVTETVTSSDIIRRSSSSNSNFSKSSSTSSSLGELKRSERLPDNLTSFSASVTTGSVKEVPRVVLR